MLQKRRAKKRQKKILTWIGIAGLIVLILGGFAWTSRGNPNMISIDDAYQKYQNGAFVLDVRTQEKWNEHHISDATLIPLDDLTSRINEVPKDQEIIIVCRSGNRSQVGLDILLEAGFEQVTYISGGLEAWINAGYPVE
ncbi:MAG: rhodanese-like domain-containing protein [Chloroflexota bacterium]|nr:rhodanese-like domain-containing protein [Chloroflexota bacterium]